MDVSKSEVKKALTASRKWLRKHVNTHKIKGVVPQTPTECICGVIEYYLSEDAIRDSPQDFYDDEFFMGLRLIDNVEVDRVMDFIESSIEEELSYSDHIDIDVLYDLCNSL